MSELRPLQEAVWRGSLPLKITLKPSDSRVYEDIHPYFVLVLMFFFSSS